MSTLKVDTITDEAGTGAPTLSQGLTVAGGTIKLDGNYPVGTGNVALGNTALDSVTSGTRLTAIGSNALTAATSGNYSVAVGSNALASATTATFNTAVGDYALQATTGGSNTGIGGAALYSTTSGQYNTALGHSALQSNTTASNNTAVGYQAGYSNTTSGLMTAVGSRAAYSNTTGARITAVGYQAAYSNTTGSNNVAIGANISGYTGTLGSNTTGNYNVAMGDSALNFNTTASSNTAIGYGALLFNTTASNNTAVGFQAGYSNTTGASNTYFGKEAGKPITIGQQNTMLGYQAGNQGGTEVSYSTYVGEGTGYSSTGDYNTFIGHRAGVSMTSGAKNTILGRYNGNSGGLDIRTASNRIVLSDGDGNPTQVTNGTSSAIVFGGTNPDDSSPTVGVQIDHGGGEGSYINVGHTSSAGNGYSFVRFFHNGSKVGDILQSGTTSVTYATSSDYRLKENVVELTGATERLKQLNPSRFNFIADADTTVDGFIAHEVQSVVPEAVTGTHNEVDADGNPAYQGIDQSKLVPLLVATIKELEARITALEAN